MRAPPPAVRFVGHPIVSGAVLLTCGPFAFFCALHGTAGLIPALIVGFVIERVMRANAKGVQYRAWKRAWDGMDDGPVAPRRGMLIASTVVAMLAVGYAAANLGDPQIQGALVFIGLALALWIGVAITRRLGWPRGRQRRPRETADRVAVRVRGPLLPVPTLQDAFRDLPEHCQCLRQSTRS